MKLLSIPSRITGFFLRTRTPVVAEPKKTQRSLLEQKILEAHKLLEEIEACEERCTKAAYDFIDKIEKSQHGLSTPPDKKVTRQLSADAIKPLLKEKNALRLKLHDVMEEIPHIIVQLQQTTGDKIIDLSLSIAGTRVTKRLTLRALAMIERARLRLR